MASSPAPLGTITHRPDLVSRGLDALLHRAAFAPIANVGWIRITGSDRVRWLNGMATNNIAGLKPGEGCYNFFLNAQGRIQGDCTAFLLEDSILLETAADRIPALMTMLDHFIIMDDVELEDISHQRYGVLVAGPQAAALIETFGSPLPDRPGGGPFIASLSHAIGGSAADLIRNHSPIIPAFELWRSAPHLIAETWAGLQQATPEDLEHLRILSGTPLYGRDIRDKDLPQETNQDTRALHFAKGCYLGQEIVERIRSRGAVHRTFTGFLLEGDAPTPGTPLTVEDKPIGELTSVARIGPYTVALGYIRREVLTRSTRIQYPRGTATPSELPFQLKF